jgi:hypothetical protein
VGCSLSRFRYCGKGLVKTIIDLPITIPELVLGLCLLIFFGSPAMEVIPNTIGLDFIFTTQGPGGAAQAPAHGRTLFCSRSDHQEGNPAKTSLPASTPSICASSVLFRLSIHIDSPYWSFLLRRSQREMHRQCRLGLTLNTNIGTLRKIQWIPTRT